MRVVGHMFGGAPILAKIQIGEALPIAGVPIVPDVSAFGAIRATTIAAPDAFGISLDAQPTFRTTQQLGDADPAAYVTVSVRRDQIVRSRLSGGPASGTDLPEFRNTVLSTDGLLITANFGTEYANGHVYAANGANVGKLRRIVDPDVDTTAIIGIAFPKDIAVGDLFYAATFGPYEAQGVTFTADIDEVDASTEGQGNGTMRCMGLFFQPKNAGGAQNSFADLVFSDHWIDE